MPDRTCSLEGCGRPLSARGFCRPHYRRWRQDGDPGPADLSSPCRGCGATIQRTESTGPIKHYCHPACRPRCSVEACDKPRHGDVYCSAHHTRWKRTGDPLTPLERTPNAGECEIRGCGQPQRKLQWCASHYAMWHRDGAIRPWHYRWADEPTCIYCGRPNGGYRSRKFCSAACVTANRRLSGTPGATFVDLAARDGALCGLCGCDVDLSARLPDPMSPSVDHISPVSRGGSNHPDNLQLAHLLCNKSKGNRSHASLFRGVGTP